MSKKIEEQMTEIRREMKDQMEGNTTSIKQQIAEVNQKWEEENQEIQVKEDVQVRINNIEENNFSRMKSIPRKK